MHGAPKKSSNIHIHNWYHWNLPKNLLSPFQGNSRFWVYLFWRCTDSSKTLQQQYRIHSRNQWVSWWTHLVPIDPSAELNHDSVCGNLEFKKGTMQDSNHNKLVRHDALKWSVAQCLTACECHGHVTLVWTQMIHTHCVHIPNIMCTSWQIFAILLCTQ